MIYGVQWDAVCDWLEQSGFDTDSKYNVVNFGQFKDKSVKFISRRTERFC